MKKLDKLIQRIEFFERLAVYGDKKTFLQRLAQDMSREPNYSSMPAPEPNASINPNPPEPSGVKIMPEVNIIGYRPIDPKVQKMLNELFAFKANADMMPIKEDGKLGDETQKALALFKAKTGKPASIAAITEVYNAQKLDKKDPGAPLPPGKINLPSGETKSTAKQNAGTEIPVPGPKF